MAFGRAFCCCFLMCACADCAAAQCTLPTPTLKSRLPAASADSDTSAPALPEAVALVVPTGMAIQIALDKEIRVRRVGQPITGHVVEPVYAFDKLVVPVGTTVAGQLAKIEGERISRT